MTQLTRQANSKLSLHKQGVAPKFWHNTTLINVALSVTLVICGLGYLGTVNSTAADTFSVATLSSKVEQSKNQNQRLELDISEVLALPHVNQVSKQANLVAATDVHYLNAPAAVAFSQ